MDKKIETVEVGGFAGILKKRDEVAKTEKTPSVLTDLVKHNKAKSAEEFSQSKEQEAFELQFLDMIKEDIAWSDILNEMPDMPEAAVRKYYERYMESSFQKLSSLNYQFSQRRGFDFEE